MIAFLFLHPAWPALGALPELCPWVASPELLVDVAPRDRPCRA